MTDSTWQNGQGGDWSDPANWQPQAVPDSPTDNATIGAAGTYTVTIAPAESEQVGRLDLTDPGVVLAVAGVLETGVATLAAGTLDLSGTLAGGTLVGAGGTFFAGGTLSGVAVAGDLVIANPYYGLTVLGGPDRRRHARPDRL